DTRSGVKKPRPPFWFGKEAVSVYSPDGRSFATLDPPVKAEGPFRPSGFIVVRDSASGKGLVTCIGLPGKPRALAFSPVLSNRDHRFLAIAGPDTEVRIWDARPAPSSSNEGLRYLRSPHHILQGHTQPVRGLAFSPDGRRLATVSADDSAERGEIKLWD